MNTSKGITITASILGVFLLVIIIVALFLGTSGTTSKNTNYVYITSNSNSNQNQGSIPYASSFTMYHTARDTREYTGIGVNPTIPINSISVTPNAVQAPVRPNSAPIGPGSIQAPPRYRPQPPVCPITVHSE